MPRNTTPADDAKPNRYIRLPELLERVGVSWITILRWERADRFPKRRKIGPNVVAWLESEIDQWCADREIALTSMKGAE